MTGLTAALMRGKPFGLRNPTTRNNAMAKKQRITMVGAMTAAALFALSSPARAETFSNLQPVNPQPAADATAPGLAVNYVFFKAHHVDDVEGEGPGEPGMPLPQLNYQNGSGNVLTSDQSDGVGALIRGFIDFPAAGRWLMTAQSNDGVRVRLSGTVVIEDPGVHSDQFAPNAEIDIAQPGWYEIAVTYFERKSTATLQLYWQPPGKSEFEIVPATAFNHLK
jgi:PA14 domain